MQRIRLEQEQMQLRKQQELMRSTAVASPLLSKSTPLPSLGATGSWSKQVGSQVPGGAWGGSKPQHTNSVGTYGDQFPSLGQASQQESEQTAVGPTPTTTATKGKVLTKQQKKQLQRQERRQQREKEKERERQQKRMAEDTAKLREMELEEQRTNSATAAVAISAASPVLAGRDEEDARATLGWGLQQLDLDSAVSSPPLQSLTSSGHGSISPVLSRVEAFSPESSPGAIGSRSPAQSRAAGAFGGAAFPGEEFSDPRKRPPGFGKFMQQGFGNIWSNQYINQPAFGMDPWAAPEEEEPTGLRGLQALDYGLPGQLGAFSGPTTPVQQPCCYCGAESTIACPMCSQMGLSTYFCSPEHQRVVWEEHLRFHTHRESTS